MDDISDDEIPIDTWISLADILCQPRGANEPKVTIALLKDVIEAEGVRTHDQWGKMIWATDGDERERTSKARVYKLLAQYYAETEAYHELPPGVEPNQDPNRWLEYDSPFVKFGWPRDDIPDFAEWINKFQYSTPTLSTINSAITTNNLEAESEQKIDANPNNSSTISDIDSDRDKELSDLFDPVTVQTLENMFQANGNWKKWAERASRNGLINSRKGRAKFNPYEAAMWFMNQGIDGWDLARCHRVLVKNLPPRSRDSAYLLTGELE